MHGELPADQPGRDGGRLASGPLGLLGFDSPNIAQRHAPDVEMTAAKAFMLSDCV